MPRIAFRPLVLIAVLALMAVIVGAQAPVPQPEDQETAREVVDLVERNHMAHPQIDDEIAVKWCDNFIKKLDPQKYHFLKSDVAEFRKEAKTLDDQIRMGNIDFAHKVFDRFLERSDERFKAELELLKEKFDFTKDESIDDDPDKIDFPADKAEADKRLRKKVKLDVLIGKVVEELSDADAVAKWKIRYKDRNRLWHQVDSSELLELYLSSLTETFDPHSSFLSQKNLEDLLNQQLHLQLEGIGASLRSEDGYAVVQEVVPGMAADKDGRLQPEDKIIGIQRENGEEVDLVEKKLNDVVRYIRGPRGTKVRLIVQPDGTKERRIYELTRERIELKEQHAKGKILEAKGPEGKTFKLGVINLPAFYGDTMAMLKGDPDAVSATADCKKILEDFQKAHVDAVVMDLRGNGGGLLEEAKTLSGLFIDTGPVVQVKETARRQASRRRGAGDGLGWPARRPDRQGQRQRLGDLRRRHQGLRPGPDHRRCQHLRQGHGAEHRADPGSFASSHPRRPGRQSRCPEADDPAVLPRQRRQHPDQGRRPPHPHPLDARPARFRRGQDG